MEARTESNWLDLFPEGDYDDAAYACSVCQERGACRDWIECMAFDAECNAQWLAREVYRGNIDSDWSVEDVRREWVKARGRAERVKRRAENMRQKRSRRYGEQSSVVY